jgi:methylglutaconyl-CoA hydratase
MLKIEKKKFHTVIRLNRPEKRNALSCVLMKELVSAIDAVMDSPDQRAIVFLAEGPVFCAGLDLNELTDQSKAKESASLLSTLLKRIHTFPITTICGVHGSAMAGGAALMACCDIVLSEEDASIGFPEVRRGIVAGFVSAILSRQLRQRDIKELLLIGEPVTASRAREMGLVTRVVPKGTLHESMDELVEKVLKGAPQTMRLSKGLLEKLDPSPLEQSWAVAESFHLQSRASGEAKEGVQAFLEKRQPRWVS